MYTEYSNQSEITSRETSHVASFAPTHCESITVHPHMHIPYPDDYYTAPPSYQSPISKFIRPPVVYVRIPISGYSVIGITDPTYMLQPLYRAIAVYAACSLPMIG